ncbi:MAG: GntR family transcriptional regulator [Candidatus Latescibacteria bacterium]|nr:GntR family transcriptional regulator [Candidatus Latescibacterota bacterium]MBT4141350.1 GntR family transcriptional regulator [Candidatus Latescibacterota bacterium]MBT5829607.1 GntR family transcriptional regulator [Candidatus Latescibacterota bacterium]
MSINTRQNPRGRFARRRNLAFIRALASEQRVSVITVQRAYERLDRDGLIQSRRRRGFFVAPISAPSKKKRAEQ